MAAWVTIAAVAGPIATPGRAYAAVPQAAPVRSERLAALIPTPGPIDLRGTQGDFTVFFNMSTRIDPVRASLHLEMSNSQALMTPRSQLVVKLNGAVVAQVALKSGAPLTSADIDLPAELLRGGSNRLTFAAAQHATTECEQPDSSELWSQIDTSRSRLVITGADATRAPRLSELQELIGPGLFGGRRFTLMTPPQPDGVSDAALATGAALSEALALRLRYQPAEIDLADARPAGGDPLLRLAMPVVAQAGAKAASDPGDLVLFGTRDALAPMLGPVLAQAIGGSGFLGLYAMPGDRQRLVLVVSGQTDADVLRAATALGVANFPFVDAAHQTIDRVDVQAGEAFFSRNELTEGTRTAFSELGFHTTTLRGSTASTSVDITMPADLYTPDSAEAELSLDFAYGAGLRSDSVVNLMLNGEFLQGLALPDRSGAVLRDYRIKIPARKFRAGHNTLAFDAVMTPSVSSACMPTGGQNLILSLADTSSLKLPMGDRMASQPDLRLFSATGFPYVGSGGFDVALAERDPATVAAGWTVLARLAQLAGRTLPEGRLLSGAPQAGRHAILIGATPDLPPEMLAGLPPGLRPGSSLPYASAAPQEPRRLSWRDEIHSYLGMAAQAEEVSTAAVTRVEGSGQLGRNGLLTAARAPGGSDRTVTLLTAGSRDDLRSAVLDLVQPTIWYQLAKDMSLWRPGETAVSTQRIGPTYHIGTRSTLYAARYYIGEYPAAWIGTVAASVLLLAGTVRMLIVRRRRRALPDSFEGIP